MEIGYVVGSEFKINPPEQGTNREPDLVSRLEGLTTGEQVIELVYEARAMRRIVEKSTKILDRVLEKK